MHWSTCNQSCVKKKRIATKQYTFSVATICFCLVFIRVFHFLDSLSRTQAVEIQTNCFRTPSIIQKTNIVQISILWILSMIWSSALVYFSINTAIGTLFKYHVCAFFNRFLMWIRWRIGSLFKHNEEILTKIDVTPMPIILKFGLYEVNYTNCDQLNQIELIMFELLVVRHTFEYFSELILFIGFWKKNSNRTISVFIFF